MNRSASASPNPTGNPRSENSWTLSAIFLLATSLLMQSFTPVLFKYGSMSADTGNLWELATNWLFLAGMTLFGARMVLWQVLLRRFPLSFLHPFQSLTLVLVLLLGSMLFGEKISWANIAGTALIVFAVSLLSLPAARSPTAKPH